MFGSTEEPKHPDLHPRPVPKLCDVPGDRCNFGHIAREPNTCFDVKFMQYTQWKNDDVKKKQNAMTKKIKDEISTAKYIKHSQMMSYKRHLNEKVNKKMEEYDQSIEVRRKKLGELIWKEEREILRDIVDEVQKQKQVKIEEKLTKLKEIKERKEAERQAIVEEKRLQQYLNRCVDFRPIKTRQLIEESKQIQLLQIKDNEIKKKSAEEEDYFWHQMMMRYYRAIAEREENERRNQMKLNKEIQVCVDLQVKEKMAQKEKERQEILGEGKQLDNLKRQLEEEDRAYLEQQNKSKKQLLESFKEQIRKRREILQSIAEQEKKMQNIYFACAEIEIEKYRQKCIVDSKADEAANYYNYAMDLKRQKEEQERLIDKEIIETMKKIQQEEDEKKCKIEDAKKAFKEAVLKSRQEHREENIRKKEELKRLEELENEFTNAIMEQSIKLKAEYERQLLLKEKKYREDLKQQILYQKELKAREEEIDKRILDSAVPQNEHYEKIFQELLMGKAKISEVHPFRKVFNKDKCVCTRSSY